MMSWAAQVQDNLQCLQSLGSLLVQLPVAHYRGARAGQSIGQHVRHILEHYQCLWQALDQQCELDYEQRPRQSVLEQSTDRALADLERHCQRLRQLSHATTPLSLQLHSVAPGHSGAVTTSLARELAFLASHTVHHQALIKLLATQMGHTLPPTFGVHHSTLKHWARQAEAG
ncbi:MAG: DinB family protein [Saccharospirillum sp.]